MAINPMVSVVIPSYNASKYVGALLDGFEEQLYQDWELIIVDDVSNDSTIDIINKYIAIDPRIKLLVRDRMPKGAQTCRNIGIEKATGQYVIIIDADDLVKPCFLQQRVEFMKKHPDIDYATFKGESIRQEADGSLKKGTKWGLNPHKDILECFLNVNYPFGVWNNIYKAELVERVHFDERIQVYQDFDFIVNTILKGYKHSFAESSEVDYLYRQGHSGRITSSFLSEEKYESTKYLFGKTMDLLRVDKKYNTYKKCFFKFFLLQYERVLINGNYEQSNDFRKFLNNTYGFPKNLKINLSWELLRNSVSNRDRNLSKKVFFVVYLLFSPMELVKWIGNKLFLIFQR